jgi:type II secretory pathway component PulF
MNSTKINRIISSLIQKIEPRRRVDLSILSDLLESEIDDQEIFKILNINLKDEHQLRKILKYSDYGQYLRLSHETDPRKALLVVLYSKKLSNRLKSQSLKHLSYPSFLFFSSLIMMIFVNSILLPMFQSMLLFLGPKLNVFMDSLILILFILLDVLIIASILIFLFLLRSNPIYLYGRINDIKKQNLWTRLLTHQFCEKFLYFYHLGGSIDIIFKQIQLSSSMVLNHLCFEVLNELENGSNLANSIIHIDPQLQAYFKMSDEGIDITKYLHHYTIIQELIVMDQIKRYGKTLLAYTYIKITFMIIILYQVMLKPIEMMEKLL